MNGQYYLCETNNNVIEIIYHLLKLHLLFLKSLGISVTETMQPYLYTDVTSVLGISLHTKLLTISPADHEECFCLRPPPRFHASGVQLHLEQP